MGKFQSGILNGNILFHGAYDECLAINVEKNTQGWIFFSSKIILYLMNILKLDYIIYILEEVLDSENNNFNALPLNRSFIFHHLYLTHFVRKVKIFRQKWQGKYCQTWVYPEGNPFAAFLPATASPQGQSSVDAQCSKTPTTTTGIPTTTTKPPPFTTTVQPKVWGILFSSRRYNRKPMSYLKKSTLSYLPNL